MIKLLSYQHVDNRTEVNFEKEQFVYFYLFGGEIYTVTSDNITKSAVKEIKQHLLKNGLNCNLNTYIGQEFKEYFEEGSYER